MQDGWRPLASPHEEVITGFRGKSFSENAAFARVNKIKIGGIKIYKQDGKQKTKKTAALPMIEHTDHVALF
jgi:hypothetical protein